jgi:probable HAF family extracellular repeat protein
MLLNGSAVRRIATVISVLLTVGCSSELPTEGADLEIRAAKGGSTGGSTKGSGIVVGGAIPNAAKRSTTLDVRIIGSGFDRNLVAKWAIDSVVTSDVVVNSTRFVSSTELVANITVSSTAQLTEYDIILTSTKGGKPGIGTELFEVVEELPLTGLGGSYSMAYAANETGLIAGAATIWVNGKSSQDRPVIWQNGVPRDLLPTGYTMGRALDVNENGQVVGWIVSSAGNLLPFVWSEGTGLRALPILPGETQNGATAINDAGVVVGWSGRSAVRWVNGVVEVLHTLPNQWSSAVDINNQGTVVGYYEPTINDPIRNAWVWTSGSGATDLPTLSGTSGTPSGINDLGQVIGNGPANGGYLAFIRENGVTRPLFSSAFSSASAMGISELGHVVGNLPDGRAVMRDPNGIESVVCVPVTPTNNALTRCGASGVNSSAHVVGFKTDDSGYLYKAYRWVPQI